MQLQPKNKRTYICIRKYFVNCECLRKSPKENWLVNKEYYFRFDERFPIGKNMFSTSADRHLVVAIASAERVREQIKNKLNSLLSEAVTVHIPDWYNKYKIFQIFDMVSFISLHRTLSLTECCQYSTISSSRRTEQISIKHVAYNNYLKMEIPFQQPLRRYG